MSDPTAEALARARLTDAYKAGVGEQVIRSLMTMPDLPARARESVAIGADLMGITDPTEDGAA